MSLHLEKRSSLYFLQKEIWPLPHLFCVWEQIICIELTMVRVPQIWSTTLPQIHLHAAFPVQEESIKTVFHGSWTTFTPPAAAVWERTILKYLGSSGDDEYRGLPHCPSQTIVATAAAFKVVKQPFGKFVMGVCTMPCHQSSTVGTRARWQHSAAGSGPTSRPSCRQSSVGTRRGPAAAGLALGCKHL